MPTLSRHHAPDPSDMGTKDEAVQELEASVDAGGPPQMGKSTRTPRAGEPEAGSGDASVECLKPSPRWLQVLGLSSPWPRVVLLDCSAKRTPCALDAFDRLSASRFANTVSS